LRSAPVVLLSEFDTACCCSPLVSQTARNSGEADLGGLPKGGPQAGPRESEVLEPDFPARKEACAQRGPLQYYSPPGCVRALLTAGGRQHC
jgi:hypothetical protein